MNALRIYLNGLSADQQHAFAQRCGTSVSYMRKAISLKQLLGINLVISIERESQGAVRCEQLRRDVDWEYLKHRWADAS